MAPPATPMSSAFILCVLGLMAVLIWRKVHVLVVLGAASVMVLALFRVHPWRFLRALCDIDGPFLLRALKLLPLVYLINLLGTLLRESGRESVLVDGLDDALGDRRLSAAFLPMSMGLLPMPGGALLSASMVEMALGEREAPAHKAAINLWFRHVWEVVDPLYPGLILSTQFFCASFGELALANWSIYWAVLLFGTVFLLRRLGRAPPKRGTSSRLEGMTRVAGVLAPVLVAVFLTLLDRVFKETAFQHFVAPVGVGVGVLVAVFLWRAGREQFFRAARKAAEWKILLLVVLALLLASTIEISGAVDGLHADLVHYRVPAIVIIAALPFLAGFLTGLTVAFVGMTMPIVVALTSTGAGGLMAGFSVAYTAGFLGVLFSPVHLCVLLSAEKFGAHIGSIYRWMILPGLGVAAVLALQVAAVKWLPGIF